MAKKVKNLTLDVQTDSNNTIFATWEFNTTSSSNTATSSALKKGDKVKVKSGAKWYNGTTPSSWVYDDTWIVYQVSGVRVVLNKNASGTKSVMSAIHSKYLTKSGSTSSTTVSSSTLDHYKLIWNYATGDGVWFEGTTAQTDYKNATYSPPANATKVRVKVKPVSKTYKKKNKDVKYWTGEYVSKIYYMSHTPPDAVSTPDVEIDKFKLTASVLNITDSKADKIEFYILNGTKKFASAIVDVKTCQAIYTVTVPAGGKYRVRCRAVNMVGTTKVYGEWSDYSAEKTTIPKACTDLKCKVQSDKTVKITWVNADGGDNKYEIQYATDKNYFDRSSEVSSTTVDVGPAYITGLEEGRKWYFRIRAVNDEGESSWSSIASAIIGTKPEAPTTWSLTNSVMVGDKIKLYWTHNSEDGSNQTDAVIRLRYKLGDDTAETIENESWDAETVPEYEEEPTYYYEIDTSTKDYKEGGYIRWAVKTKGIHAEYSEYSTIRKIDIYAPPTLVAAGSTTDADILDAMPFAIALDAGPSTQKVLSYHIAIQAMESYTTEDEAGNQTRIAKGDVIFSKVYTNTKNKDWSTYAVKILAGDVNFENGRPYKLTATVAMNSGLTATDSFEFETDFPEYEYDPTATVEINRRNLSARIMPVCYIESDTDEEGTFADVTLSVYRREYDGTFTLIRDDILNDGRQTVIDKHPSLDYARYRIVATDNASGLMEFTDIPGEPVDESSIVIQWNEQHFDFDYTEDADPEEDPVMTSIVKLPANVDISEDHDPDVSLIEYIGRKHPVSYYGTQRGETASWSTEVPKDDKETLFMLRRLAAWNGDVYVREPSGVGYWAQVKVAMSRTHLDLTIPVSFSIKRVEGGA